MAAAETAGSAGDPLRQDRLLCAAAFPSSFLSLCLCPPDGLTPSGRRKVCARLGEEGLARGRGPGAHLPQCFPCSALPLGDRMGTCCQTWGCFCCLGTQDQLMPPPLPLGAGCRQPVQSLGECRRHPFAASGSRAQPRPLSWRAGSRVLEPPSGLGCGRPRTWLACICWEAPADTDAADADRLPWEGPWGGGRPCGHTPEDLCGEGASLPDCTLSSHTGRTSPQSS